VQRQVARLHALDEAHAGLLVVARGERRRQPQAKRPRRRQRRAAGELREVAQDVLRRRAKDQEILEALAGQRKLHAGRALRGDFEGDRAGLVDEHAVAAVRQIKRHALVRLVGAGAAILVVVLHDLTVFHEGRETLAEPVHVFAHAELQALVHVRLAVDLRVRHTAPRRAREVFARALEGDFPARLFHVYREIARAQHRFIGTVFDDDLVRRLRLHRDLRIVVDPARVVFEADLDDVGHRRAERDRDQRTAERVATVLDIARRRIDHELAVQLGHRVRFGGIKGGDARLHQPLTIGELHSREKKRRFRSNLSLNHQTNASFLGKESKHV